MTTKIQRMMLTEENEIIQSIYGKTLHGKIRSQHQDNRANCEVERKRK